MHAAILSGVKRIGDVYVPSTSGMVVLWAASRSTHVANTSAETESSACADNIIKSLRIDQSTHVADASAERRPPAVVDNAVEPANPSVKSIS